MRSGQGPTSTSKQKRNQLTNRRLVAVRQTDRFRKKSPHAVPGIVIIGHRSLENPENLFLKIIVLLECSGNSIQNKFRFQIPINKFQISSSLPIEARVSSFPLLPPCSSSASVGRSSRYIHYPPTHVLGCSRHRRTRRPRSRHPPPSQSTASSCSRDPTIDNPSLIVHRRHHCRSLAFAMTRSLAMLTLIG